MSGPGRLRTPQASACRWRRLPGVGAVLATLVVGGGLFPSRAQAQKNIFFTTTGSVRSTLVFTNQISPDVYAFFATAGERIRVQTSNNSFDTTLRVIGPDAAINLFDDDGGSVPPASVLASRLVFTAADTGWYLVVVSSFSGNPGGTIRSSLPRARRPARGRERGSAGANRCPTSTTWRRRNRAVVQPSREEREPTGASCRLAPTPSLCIVSRRCPLLGTSLQRPQRGGVCEARVHPTRG
jgi:hypothetical protein